jgi:hypothetical protein
VVEGSMCNCFFPTWKQTSRVMIAKMSQNVTWVPMCSLPWAQHKRWTLVTLMGCVHTHQRILAIERCSLSHIWNIVEKGVENNQKVGKVG